MNSFTCTIHVDSKSTQGSLLHLSDQFWIHGIGDVNKHLTDKLKEGKSYFTQGFSDAVHSDRKAAMHKKLEEGGAKKRDSIQDTPFVISFLQTEYLPQFHHLTQAVENLNPELGMMTHTYNSRTLEAAEGSGVQGHPLLQNKASLEYMTTCLGGQPGTYENLSLKRKNLIGILSHSLDEYPHDSNVSGNKLRHLLRYVYILLTP